uniref:vitronectin-like isoform X2 n=1 Tax=Myxine glutinosa TaxID=7769 RepID=UPI00358E7D3A
MMRGRLRTWNTPELLLCVCLGVSIIAGVVSFETQSCEGRCSKTFTRGLQCSCDSHCLQFDQCCSDYIDQCTSPVSCEGRCFSKFMRGKDCQCDEACQQFGECCSDFNNTCVPDDGEFDDYSELPADDPMQWDDPWAYPETDADEYADEDVDEDAHEDVNEDVDEDAHEDDVDASTIEDKKINGEADCDEERKTITNEQIHPEEVENSPTDTDLCQGDPPNAFTTLSNGAAVVFRGGLSWRLGPQGIMGFPRRLQTLWGITGTPDAVFTRCSCEPRTYIFKDSRYWRLTNGKMDPTFPRSISRGFAGLTGKVNAVLPIPAFRNHQEAAYFLQGKKVRRYIFKQSGRPCKKRRRSQKPFLPESLFPLPRHPSRFSSSSRLPSSHGRVQISTVSIRNRGRQRKIGRKGRQRHRRSSTQGRRSMLRRKPTYVQRRGELSRSILTTTLWRGSPARIDSFATFPTYRKRDLIPYKFYITSGVNIYPLDIVRNTVSAVPVGNMKKHWFRCP